MKKILLTLVLALVAGNVMAAIPREKGTDRLSAKATASVLEPVYACGVFDPSDERVANLVLPNRPAPGDTLRDVFQRERTITEVTVLWSASTPATAYQPARIACVIELAPL